MKINRKSLGHWVEVVGLCLVLIGAAWQSSFSGWWDRELFEWEFMIQEKANLGILNGLSYLSLAENTADVDKRSKYLISLSENLGSIYGDLVAERVKRDKALRDGQASLFKNIEKFFTLTGAFLIIVGKYVGADSKTADGSGVETSRKRYLIKNRKKLK